MYKIHCRDLRGVLPQPCRLVGRQGERWGLLQDHLGEQHTSNRRQQDAITKMPGCGIGTTQAGNRAQIGKIVVGRGTQPGPGSDQRGYKNVESRFARMI